MRFLLLTSIIGLLSFRVCGGVVQSEDSPDRRFMVTLEYPAPRKSFPKIYLVEKATHAKTLLFDFEEFEDNHANWSASWSPDSKHVAICTEIERTISLEVFHVDHQKVSTVKFLPIPASLDKEPPKIRGGPDVDHWQDANTLWIYDNSKHRVFRYHFTKEGRLLADKFEERDP